MTKTQLEISYYPNLSWKLLESKIDNMRSIIIQFLLIEDHLIHFKTEIIN